MIQEDLENRLNNKDLMISEVEVIPGGEKTLAIIAEVCKSLENEEYGPTQENLVEVGLGSHDVSGGGISWSVDVIYYALRVSEHGVWVLICESCFETEEGDEECAVDVEDIYKGSKRCYPIISDSSLKPEQVKDAFRDWLYDEKENLFLIPQRR